MAYGLDFAPAAIRDLKRIPRDIRADITQAIDTLGADPRPHACEKREGSNDLFRVRCGDYRIIYQIQNDVLMVLVVRVRHRREVYKDLSSLMKRYR